MMHSTKPCKLPDVLAPSLAVVFCGTAAGTVSAACGLYYSGPGNRFWPTLREEALVPEDFSIEHYQSLPTYGIGLTDLIKNDSGMDQEIRRATPEDRNQIDAIIANYHPKILAFTSQRAACEYLDTHNIELGSRPHDTFPEILIYVLPSPSRANGHWAKQHHHWSTLAQLVKRSR